MQGSIGLARDRQEKGEAALERDDGATPAVLAIGHERDGSRETLGLDPMAVLESALAVGQLERELLPVALGGDGEARNVGAVTVRRLANDQGAGDIGTEAERGAPEAGEIGGGRLGEQQSWDEEEGHGGKLVEIP